ncbi:MAG: TldD/PmbA family protein [Oscillospiraceae bacterium]
MIQDILSGWKTRLPAGVHTELRAQVNAQRVVGLMSGNLIRNERTDISGVSARTYKNGVYGFASMAELSDEAIANVVKASVDNAAFLDRHIQKNKPLFPAIPGGRKFMDVSLADPEQKLYVDLIKQVDDYIQQHCPNLVSRMVLANCNSVEKLLITSDGMDAHTIIPRAHIMVVLTAMGDNGAPVELFTTIGGPGSILDQTQDMSKVFEKVDEIYERVMLKRSGVYPEAGVKTVVMGSSMAGILAHEAVGHTVEADLVLGGSVAGPMLNKQVASPIVNLTDFANTAFGQKAPQPVYVDDEGTPAEDAVLIKDGMLVGYMNSRETAERFGMKPCGNMRAWLFSDEPLIRMRNTAILPGKDKLEDMIASVDDGYYLLNYNNGQADTTGEFMFGICYGFEIKNGKLGRPILDTTITGVAFDMLKTVDMISDEVKWSSSGTCGKKQPMPVGMGGPALRCKVMIGGR